jgi:hypothetical protein
MPPLLPKRPVEEPNQRAASSEEKSEHKSVTKESGRWSKQEDSLFREGIIWLMYRT